MISLVILCRLTILLSKEMFDEAFKLAEQYNLDRKVQCTVYGTGTRHVLPHRLY